MAKETKYPGLETHGAASKKRVMHWDCPVGHWLNKSVLIPGILQILKTAAIFPLFRDFMIWRANNSRETAAVSRTVFADYRVSH